MLMLSHKKIMIIALAVSQLLLIPIILWLVGWQWSLKTSYGELDKFLFLLLKQAVRYSML